MLYLDPHMNNPLQYPIGPFASPKEINPESIHEWITNIEAFPALLKMEIQKLSEAQLDTAYRPGGWSVRQVVHHCADSHMNSFIRFKLALTEENPTIKPYFEGLWAEMSDAKTLPVVSSLAILEGLHVRWVALLRGMDSEDFARTFFHPENQKSVRLDKTIALYSWHGLHHLGHVKLVSGH
ncbi:YfiT family bacillithiol transferase [Rhodonellum sp.]|uniref:YfiT family bacillithiol transferase n=1 Tax=Rhodonellum sp. TaxID=2231180 RepID=UPI0027281F88|nr:putative metal-dependent hydrolase [Rhodonellum sp.]MDO9554307.1 putative metal-dependent hydrolase [Rhodonellum sp.]